MSALEGDRHPLLPDFCEQGNLLRTMLIAQLLAFILMAAQTGDWLERLRSLATISLFIQWVAVVSIALLCALQRPLSRLHDGVAAVLAFALLLGVTLAFTVIAYALAEFVRFPLGEVELATLLAENATISAIVSAIALRYFYVTAQWRRQVEQAAEARVQALQARIRPHFLFNSMNTIAHLTRSDAATAESAVEDLAELFRASLGQAARIPLAEELDLVDSYMRLERQRLGERLTVEWSLDPAAGEVEVPALTLQPLVENAVYHGVEQCAAGGCIRIATRREADGVTITVDNPTAGGAGGAASGQRMAQDNVRQRLALAYGGRARMEADADAGHYRVRLFIPASEGDSA